jgi:hypothetical protein
LPNFYAKEVLSHGAYCLSQFEDKLIAPIMSKAGICKSIDSYGYRKDKDGLPLIEDCQSRGFFIYYTSPESLTLFRALYSNDFGMQDKYVAFQSHVSKKLSGNKFVIGFDPLNEPGPGKDSLYKLIVDLMPKQFDTIELTPLYTRLY